MSEAVGIERVLVVFTHPAGDGSLSGAILKSFCEGLEAAHLEVRVRDLYRLEFQPVLSKQDWVDGFAGKVPEDCLREQEHLRWADALAFIYPAWNWSMPAMLKGYLDRAFVIPGFSFQSDPAGATYRGGLLKHKKAQIIQTLGGALQTGYRFGNTSDYVQGLVSALHYTGIRDVHVQQFWNLYRQTDPKSEKMLRLLERCRLLGERFNLEEDDLVQTISTSLPD